MLSLRLENAAIAIAIFLGCQAQKEGTRTSDAGFIP